MELRRNNEGITLIELIISMAITAIVLSMLIIIINVAANSFKQTNEDVNLQLEAQMAINQLSTILMEAGDFDKDEEVAAPDIKYLLKGASDNYMIYFKEDKKRLYLVSESQAADYETLDPSIDEDMENQYLMAEYVKAFKIVMTGKTAKITTEFELGDQTYKTSKNINLRNMK